MAITDEIPGFRKNEQKIEEGFAVVYYHPTIAPDGQEFDKRRCQLPAMAESGWADHPAKVGVNPGNAWSESLVEEMSADYKAKRIPAFEELAHHSQQNQNDDLLKRNMALEEEVRQSRSKNEQLQRQQTELNARLENLGEQTADKQSDAAKLRGSGTAAPRNQDSAMRQQEHVPVDETKAAEGENKDEQFPVSGVDKAAEI